MSELDIKVLQKWVALEGLSECARFHESLAPYTSFRIGGIAQVLLTPRTEVELKKTVLFCQKYELKPLLLGGGSNLLIVQEVLPLVVSLRKFRTLSFDEDTVYAGAGVPLCSLVRNTIKRGLGGLEVLGGIPGTVGGALAGNAGGRWEGKRVDIGDFVEEVRVLDLTTDFRWLPRSAIEFGYRSSSLSDFIIVEAAFQLKPIPASELEARYRAALDQKKQSQPLKARSAGCIFKNPPEIPAWRAIQQAGLVGKKIGAAMVSKKHANFIVNLGGARGVDVWNLIEYVRTQVKRLCGIDLILEVKTW